MNQLTENAKAILLLCGRFGPSEEPEEKPLTTKEYDDVAKWLQSKQWWPEDLLIQSRVLEMESDLPPIERNRLHYLLGRGAAMAFAIERWTNAGLWVVCRSDTHYPARLKNLLKRSAAPILYGAGNPELLSQGGIAVVGSRNVDERGEGFAREIGRKTAECGMQIVSGAARGVDEFAMYGAFAAGGSVLGIIADSLLRAAVSPKYREGLMEGRLALISPFSPEASFSVGSAMGRNKYIYALSDISVIVSADYKKGGTWAGALEELKSKSGRPMYVRISSGVPKGNTELIKLGAKAFPADALKSNLRDLMLSQTASQNVREYEPEMDLFSQINSISIREPGVQMFQDQPSPVGETMEDTKHQSLNKSKAEPDSLSSAGEALMPEILSQLAAPKALEELAIHFAVLKSQMHDWLRQLIAEGKVVEKDLNNEKKFTASTGNEE